MKHLAIWTFVLTLTATPVLGQYSGGGNKPGGATIKWGSDVKQAVEQAKRTRLPLMFWVIPSSADRSRYDHIERDQIRVFGDAKVLELSKRFICCKLPRGEHKPELQKWNIRDPIFDLVFVTPGGDRIDDLGGEATTRPGTLPDKMSLVFRAHRDKLFEKELRPTLENEKADARELKSALETIDDFTILTADKAVLALLKREGLTQEVTSKALTVLSTLATEAAIKELFDRAATDKRADEALRKAPAGAAAYLIEYVGGEDPARHLLAYDLVCAICKIKDAKKDAFWGGKNEKLKDDEGKRVKKLATTAAQKWKERHEEYR